MGRPSAARETLRLSPLMKASRADAACVESVPRMTACAVPLVVFARQPSAERAAEGGSRSCTDSCARVQSPLASHHSPARACESPAGGADVVSDWQKSSNVIFIDDLASVIRVRAQIYSQATWIPRLCVYVLIESMHYREPVSQNRRETDSRIRTVASEEGAVA